MNKISAIISTLACFLLISCSASTSSRYEKKEKESEKTEKKEEADKKNELENFDIEPYRAKIEIEENDNASPKNLDVWYNYENPENLDTASLQIAGQADGYRVQVFVSDNLEEADSIRTELYSVTNQRAVYISFDPPFYKVKVGDFSNISEAKNLSFKLNQLGYSKSRVINDKINLFK